MNYRHAFHAGNFADVVKHVALVAILLHLRKKEKPFRVIDTHAGRGIYDLAGDEAQRTGEAEAGIARLGGLAAEGLPPSLAAYLDIVSRSGAGRYPGSPLIAAQMLRPQDRLIAIEKHADEEALLRRTLRQWRGAKTICADGYERLPALLPPPERRGLVLVDPPYEAADEFARVAAAVAAARRRFATGIMLVWYPEKSQASTNSLAGEIATAGSDGLLRLTIETGKTSVAPDGKERLTAAGLLVVNPPYGMAQEMQAVAKILAPRLGQSGPAAIAVATI